MVFFSSISFGPYLAQPLLRLGLGEAVGRRRQFFLHLGKGESLQIVFRIWLRSRFGVGRFGLDDRCRHDLYSFYLLPSLTQLRMPPGSPASITTEYSSAHEFEGVGTGGTCLLLHVLALRQDWKPLS